MDEQQLKDRTKKLGIRVIKLVELLPKSYAAEVIGKQVLRSSTSVGANYRAACRARSTADLIAKLGLVEEEADETLYWLEMLIEGGIIPQNRLTDLMSETNEILSIMIASIKTLRARERNNPKSKIQNPKS